MILHKGLNLQQSSIDIYILRFMTFLLLFLTSQFTYSAFLDLDGSARPLGMGNAFVAVTNDVNSIIYNPAGLSQITKTEFLASYTSLYPGVSSLNKGLVSLAFIIKGIGTLGVGWYGFYATELYQENKIIVSYGRKIFDLPEIGKLSLGANIKYLLKRYGTNEWTEKNPVFSEKNTTDGYTFDLGILFSSARLENLIFGGSLKNITQPNLGIYSQDRVPMNIRLGMSYRPAKGMIVATDFILRDRKIKCHVGSEIELLAEELVARVGFGFGSNNYIRLNMGAGYILKKIKDVDMLMDYAYIFPFGFVENSGGEHRVSLNIRFAK